MDYWSQSIRKHHKNILLLSLFLFFLGACAPEDRILVERLAVYLPGGCGDTSALTLDSNHENTLYISVIGEGVAKSENGGESWVWIKQDKDSKNVYSLLALPDGRLLAGTADGHIFETRNQGQDWHELLFLKDTGIYRLAADKQGNIFAGTTQGVFVNKNQSEAWVAQNQGLSTLDVRALEVSENTVYAGINANGVFVTTNMGNTWQKVAKGLEDAGVFALLIDQIQGKETIYAGTSLQGLWQYVEGDGEWTRLTEGLDTADVYGVYAIVTDPESQDLFVGTNGQGVFVSSDKGVTWRPFGGEFANVRVSTLISSKNQAGVTEIYAGIWAGDCLMKASIDAVSWQIMNKGLSGTTNISIEALSISPNAKADADRITAAVRHDGQVGIVESMDGGLTWSLMKYPIPVFSEVTIMIGPDTNNAFWLGTASEGVWRCENGGLVCKQLSTGFPSHPDPRLADRRLAQVNILTFLEQPCGALAGTDNGIYKTDADCNWHSYSDGLSSGTVRTVIDSQISEYQQTRVTDIVILGASPMVYAVSQGSLYQRSLTSDDGWEPILPELRGSTTSNSGQLVVSLEELPLLYFIDLDGLWLIDPIEEQASEILKGSFSSALLEPNTNRLYVTYQNGVVIGVKRGKGFDWQTETVKIPINLAEAFAIPSPTDPMSFYLLSWYPSDNLLFLVTDRQLIAGLYTREQALFTLAMGGVLIIIVLAIVVRHRTQVAKPVPRITNPYVAGSIVRHGSRVFRGREDIFEDVRQSLLNPDAKQSTFWLTGDRRMGKSSVLESIADGILGDEFIAVNVDVQLLAGCTDSKEFLTRVADTMVKHPKIAELNLDLEEFQDPQSDGSKAFGGLLERIGMALKDKIVILMFDEFDTVWGMIKAQQLPKSILRQFRGWANLDGFAYIYAGLPKLISNVEWAELLNITKTKYVGYLDKEDTVSLIIEPVSDRIRYEEEAVNEVWKLTQGHPYWTQYICRSIVDDINALIDKQENKQVSIVTVTLDEVESAVNKCVRTPEAQMEYLWDRWQPLQQKIASIIAEISVTDEKAVNLSKIQGMLRQYHHTFSDSDLNSAIDNLVEEEILREEQAEDYQFKVPLIARWIARQHSIENTLKESSQ